MFAEMFAGTIRGRYPWPLPTGAGKTTALVSVIVALENLKINGPSLAVASSTVEALCRIKRELEAAGVPTHKIGLYHAKKFDTKRPDLWMENDDYASLPATSGNDRKPYMLVTQQKVKCDESVADYFVFNGKLRDLCCWDESLFDTEYWHIPANSFKGATATLQGLKEDYPDLVGMAEGFATQQALIKANLEESARTGRTAFFEPPKVSLETLAEWNNLIKEYRSLLHQGTKPSLPFFNQKLKAYPIKQDGGLVYYAPSLPPVEVMPNMIILDASFPIRELEQADADLTMVEDVEFDFKRYDNLIIHQWIHSSGRESMCKDFHGVSKKNDRHRDSWLAQKRAEQAVARKVAKTAASEVPQDEAILFFVFKPEQHSQANYRTILEQHLVKNGVDLQGTVLVNGEDKPRINILTFGQECGLNDYSHCKNVFLVGMLHRSEVDVVGQYIAQCDGGEHERLTNATADRLVKSEVAHTMYQALSRGCCRVTVDGQALPMKAWVIYQNLTIRKMLEVVMPGATWKKWSDGEALSDPRAIALREHLDALPREAMVEGVLIPEVKLATGLETVSRQTWRTIVDRALEGTEYEVDGRRFRLAA
jgi:hypothetical protein